MSNETLVYVLLGFNVLQFFFWGAQHAIMTNKLMSRNFADYMAIKNPPKIEAKQDKDFAAIEEQEVLDQLNGMLKPIEHI